VNAGKRVGTAATGFGKTCILVDTGLENPVDDIPVKVLVGIQLPREVPRDCYPCPHERQQRLGYLPFNTAVVERQ
jgi:hypothetical protein